MDEVRKKLHKRFMSILSNTNIGLSKEFKKEVSSALVLSTELFQSEEEIFTDLSDRKETNVITYFCFRAGLLEDIHAGKLDLSDNVMRDLMIESSKKLNEWMKMKRFLIECNHKDYYNAILHSFWFLYTKEWVDTD